MGEVCAQHFSHLEIIKYYSKGVYMKKIMRSLRLFIFSLTMLLLVGSPLTPLVHAEEDTQDIPAIQTTTVPTPKDTATPSNQTTTTPTAATATPSPEIITPTPTPTNVTTTATDKTAATTTTVDNNINSTAQSGDATVSSNTTAGDAASGDASASATIINTVNSTMNSADNQKAASFVSNVMGDVQGDIVLQPMMLKAMLEAGASDSATTTITNTSTLTNNLNLNATSGDASVIANTNAGNATTGSASTVANVVNIINSMVSANQSFVGTINIYGNLNGDILIAPGFIPQLLASNTTIPGDDQSTNTSEVVNASDTQSIINNVSLAATSGAAAIAGNTSAGSATSGNAQTNAVIFNLSGHQIVASNSLLVFVNVLGTWVGVIVDAPVGATAAAIGDGVTTNMVTQPDLSIAMDNNVQLINNITLTSQSGDARVLNNTKAGNATTGNATAIANVANISGSEIGLSGWFGVLFINVFGHWYGSFGINTASGDMPVVQGSESSTPSQAIAFVAHGSTGTTTKIFIPTAATHNGQPLGPTSQPAVLAAATVTPAISQMTMKPVNIATPVDFRFPIIIGAFFLVGVSALGLKRFLHS